MSLSAPRDAREGPIPNGAVPRDAEPRGDLLLGLQLCRANTMALTRLQLALRSGNRHCALEAIDRLHALDARIEHLVERLPTPAKVQPEWKAIAQHLEDQKIAIAFEKLALASEISGPDMISNADEANGHAARDHPASWPFALTPQPVRRQALSFRILAGALVVLLSVVAVSSVAIVVNAL